MQDTGPLVGLVLFLLLTVLFGFMTFSTYSELEMDDTGKSRFQRNMEETQKQIVEAEAAIEKLNKDIEEGQKRLRYQRARYEHFVWLGNREITGVFDQAYRDRLAKVNAGAKFEGVASDLAGQITAEKNKTKQKVRKDETDARERAEVDVRKSQELKDASLARVAAEKQTVDREEKEHRQKKNFEQSTLDEARRQLEDLTVREVERANILNVPDGKVILSDSVRNMVVIDIGTADGVRNGFRFECYAVRPGGQRVTKAYIEVQKASPNLSECMVLVKPLRLPTDNFSTYVAPEPEYRFSPYSTSPQRGRMLQELTGTPREVLMGSRKDDPVVEGDLVQNPFFSPRKRYTFYIAANKVIAHGSQASAVAYTWPHIQRVVESYGSAVASKVDLGVNYIIAQKNPRDDPEFERALALGIPVIYEWELFRFLDQ